MKIFELFAGIGAPRKALSNVHIPHMSLGFSEIDNTAIDAYCNLFYDDPKNNFGDITKIKELPKDIDLLFHGSPCQDFSKEGNIKGGEADKKTRSSLMWETVRLIKGSLPKVVIWENVASATQGRNKQNFENYLKTLEELGYNNSWALLNAKNYGTPQNRNRVFVISMLNGVKFNFDTVRSNQLYKPYNYYVKFSQSGVHKRRIPQATKQGYVNVTTPGFVDLSFPKSKTRRGRVTDDGRICPTITTQPQIYLFEYSKSRKLTAEECFYLMGFTHDDYFKIRHLSENEIYKLAGNSIVVTVLENIFIALYKENKK